MANNDPWNPTWAFDPSTGSPMQQGYGTQQGAGAINVAPGTRAGGTTNNGTTGAGSLPVNAAGKIDMGQMYLNSHTQSTDPWQNSAQFTTPASWQNFTFQNPTADWQKNFNSLSGVDKWQYGMSANTGNGSVIANAMAKAGIDPNIIKNAQTYFGGGSWAGAPSVLGLNDNSGNHSSLTQVGNQLWGTANGQRYLVKDFGNSDNLKSAWNGADVTTRQGWMGQNAMPTPTWANSAPGGTPSAVPTPASPMAQTTNMGDQSIPQQPGYVPPTPTVPKRIASASQTYNPFGKNPWGLSRVRPQ